MLVVADACVLIAFYQVERLDILQRLYDTVVVPPAVAREVRPSLGSVPTWITELSPETTHQWTAPLDSGEREALSLAVELVADAVLTDDLAARRVGDRLQLRVIGSVGILATAKPKGLVDLVGPLLTEMRANGLYVSDAICDEVLREAGEA